MERIDPVIVLAAALGAFLLWNMPSLVDMWRDRPPMGCLELKDGTLLCRR